MILFVYSLVAIFFGLDVFLFVFLVLGDSVFVLGLFEKELTVEQVGMRKGSGKT